MTVASQETLFNALFNLLLPCLTMHKVINCPLLVHCSNRTSMKYPTTVKINCILLTP
jgi:hypothetical protein